MNGILFDALPDKYNFVMRVWAVYWKCYSGVEIWDISSIERNRRNIEFIEIM